MMFGFCAVQCLKRLQNNLYLKNRHCEVDIDFKALAELTANIVASDVEFIVNKASHKAALQDVRISTSIVSEVIQNFTPSISKAVIDSYEKEHQNFSSSKTSNSENSTIGFKRN